MKISQKRLMHIELMARAISADYFATFLNPENCGKNFSMEKLPDMVETHCEVHYPLSVAIQSKCVDFWSKKCAELGKRFTIELLKKSGIFEK